VFNNTGGTLNYMTDSVVKTYTSDNEVDAGETLFIVLQTLPTTGNYWNTTSSANINIQIEFVPTPIA